MSITLQQIGPDSNGSCLDHLSAALKYDGNRAAWKSPANAYERASDYHRERMTEADQLAFDCFLVRMRDPLASEPGRPVHRFASRVSRMAELSAKGVQS